MFSIHAARRALAVAGVGFAATAGAHATIRLELRPATQTVAPGAVVNVGLYAVADGSTSQLMGAADVMFQWNPAILRLDGLSQTGAVSLLLSYFPFVDPWGNINGGVSPPTSGTGFYEAYANLGVPVTATTSGALLTTFRFTALAASPGSAITIIPNAGNNGHTVVYDGTTPNLPVTGALGSATVIVSPPCRPADANCDGVVNNFDIDGFVIGVVNIGVAVAPPQYLTIGLTQDCWDQRLCWGDVNGDHAFNNFDIDPFVACILGACP